MRGIAFAAGRIATPSNGGLGRDLGHPRALRPHGLTGTPRIEGLVQDEVQLYVRAWLDASAGARTRRVSAATAALVVSSGIIGAGVPWSRVAKRAPVERLVREICELLVPALNKGQGVDMRVVRTK